MDELSKSIGQWVKQARQKKGLSMLDLQALAGLSNAQLSRIETGMSAVTLFTIVRLCHAFNWTFTSIYRDLDLGVYDPPFLKDPEVLASADHFPVLTITDIEDFIQRLHTDPDNAQQTLRKLVENDALVAAYKQANGIQTDQNPLAVLADPNSDLATFEWPAIDLTTYRKIHINGDCLTLLDLGRYIQACRISKNLSLRKLSKDVGISHPGLIKFEKIVSDRVKLVDLLRLDQAFKLNGELLAFSWRTGELYTGTLRVQSQMERGIKMPVEWTEMEMQYIERLLLVSRTYQFSGMGFDYP